MLAAGELVLVTIPSVEREQLRDLVRCREDIRCDLVRARHRIGNFLLRREIYWEGPGEAWTRKHRSWLTSIRLSDHASQATLADYLHAHDVLIARRYQVETDLAKLARWKAQRRLNARWRQLKDARRKPGGIVAVAVARELAAYCWEIATCPPAMLGGATLDGPGPDDPRGCNPLPSGCLF